MTTSPSSADRVTPRVSESLAHRVHLLALAGHYACPPSYPRMDHRLRSSLLVGKKQRHRPRERTQAAPGGLIDAIAEMDTPPPSADKEWFSKLWSSGARQVAEDESTTAAAALATQAALIPGTIPLVVSSAPALRPLVWWRMGSQEMHLVVGPKTSASVVLLGAVASLIDEALYAATGPMPITDRVRWQLMLHIAGSALMRRLESDALEPLLVDACRDLLPPQHQAERGRSWIAKLQKQGLLDQPPGEIERTIKGIGRRYPDRLHRAWSRDFFVPRGVTLDEVLDKMP